MGVVRAVQLVYLCGSIWNVLSLMPCEILCRSALSEVWRFAEKKKVEVLRVDKNTLESLSGKKPHQVTHTHSPHTHVKNSLFGNTTSICTNN